MKRYLQLDALRGFFLIVMTLDHFGGIFSWVLYERIGYVTAAEGFVFLSGIVAGMVYSRYWDRKTLIFKSIKRTLTIYRYYIITVVVLFIMMNTVTFYNSYWGESAAAFSNFSLIGLISSILLIYQPPFVDILPMYIGLVILMPVMIYLLQKGRILFFWGFTLLLWVFGFLFGKPDILFRGTILGLFPVEGYFNFLSWQLIFSIGIFFGFKKRQNVDYSPKFTTGLLIIASFIVLYIFVVKHPKFLGFTHIRDLINNEYWFQFLFNKIRLGIGRIVNFLAISYLVAFVLMKHKSIFKFPWLIVLGQSSIKVFTVHLITYFFFRPFVPVVKEYGIFWHAIFSLSMLIPLYLVVIKDLPIRISLGLNQKQLLKD